MFWLHYVTEKGKNITNKTIIALNKPDEDDYMTVSDRVFQVMQDKRMTQKEFSELTGIPQSTVSDWRKKRTNPTADRIMVICKVLEVSPEWLLSGIQADGLRGNQMEWYAIDRNSEVGVLIDAYNEMDNNMRMRLMAYADALRGN